MSKSIPLPPLSYDGLSQKEISLEGKFSETVGLRIHRSISWIGRAERATDDDAKFIFLWIGFNAAYADHQDLTTAPMIARSAFREFFRKMEDLDPNHRIYHAIWENFSGPIRMFLYNKYVFGPFWQYHHGIEEAKDWEVQFREERKRCFRAMQNQKTSDVLYFLFNRLYVLRNQVMHGGATWNSSVNREQVHDGAAILGFLVPVFIDIIMEHPQMDWGNPSYPVIQWR